MFRSATLKLTAWYLIIIMAISLIFSFSIYQINFHEVNVRLGSIGAMSAIMRITHKIDCVSISPSRPATR